jgi:hypothetical protein
MDDALVVRGAQRAGNLDGVADRVIRVERPVCQPGPEIGAFEQLRNDERRVAALARGADVVDSQDIGVIERASWANRCRRDASCASDAGSSFNATSRVKRVSRAR